ncbi:hypothetical protein [Streptomyces sp. NPDC020996]|uniref:hypothetical protein n=1 Tax=Streptomyces sp. NPDC020996 TaxID=3154791 RepID=UPI0033C48411
MDVDEALRRLAEADGDRRRPEWCGGRYLAVAYGENLALDVEHLRSLGAERFAARGAAASLYDALDLLADDLVAATGEPVEDVLDPLEDDVSPAGDVPPLSEIVSPRRRLLALLLLGFGGPMDLVTERFEEEHYLGDALAQVPGARFVLLASAAPPHQEFALGVLELGRR